MSEHTLILGAQQHLVATLTPSASDQAAVPIVAVLTNSGVIPRSGPHRINVHLARRFAQMGIPSIRFDMSGLGDSQRSSSSLPMLQQWVADTRAVMDAAQARFGCARFFMVGFCSGAEVAHLVALEDPRLRAAVLWDLYAYPTLQSKLRTFMYRLQRAGVRGSLAKLWRKLQGRAQVMASTARQTPAIEPSPVPACSEYARRIQALVDAQVELLIAYSGGEPEWFNHAGQFQTMFKGQRFLNDVAFEFLQRSDHLITRQEAQTLFMEMVVRWLGNRVLVQEPRTSDATSAPSPPASTADSLA